MLVNFLVLLISLPSFLLREPGNLLVQSVSCAVMSLPATAGGEIRSDRLQSVDEFTLQSREALWGAAGLIFLDHPVLGAGFGWNLDELAGFQVAADGFPRREGGAQAGDRSRDHRAR